MQTFQIQQAVTYTIRTRKGETKVVDGVITGFVSTKKGLFYVVTKANGREAKVRPAIVAAR